MKKLLAIFSILFVIGFTSCTNEAENVVVSSDGVEIRFDAQGEGEPALVFVHGFSRNHNDWTSQMDYFSDRYKVVALDLAGFGESGNNRDNWTMEAFGSDVISVIEHLNLTKVILIGHSMGTPVIMKAAIQNPEKIIGLVPVDMLHDVGQKKSEEEIEQMVNAFMNMMINPTEEIIKSWFVNEVDDELVSEFIQYYKGSFKVGWEDSIRSTFKWMSDSQPDDLLTVKVPICCINSDLRIPDYELVRQYSEKFDAKIIKGIGHMVMEEAPDEFNRLLEECIKDFIR